MNNPILTQFAAESGPHISLVAEEVFSISGFSVTNSLVMGLLGLIIIIWVLVHAVRTVKLGRKPNFVDRLIIWAFEGLYGTVESVIPDKKMARRIAPLPITLFFFIIIQYWLGILPIVGSITIGDVPLFRPLPADLNTTFALAIVTMIAAQLYAIKAMGFFGNAGRYFRNPFKDPAGAFEGILELIAEFSRMVGLSLRLFGNIFAGESLLVMIAFLTTYFAPLALPPFYIFELFIGGIQAYIFFMLTTVFISLGLTHHGDNHASDESDHSPSLKEKHPIAAGVGHNS